MPNFDDSHPQRSCQIHRRAALPAPSVTLAVWSVGRVALPSSFVIKGINSADLFALRFRLSKKTEDAFLCRFL